MRNYFPLPTVLKKHMVTVDAKYVIHEVIGLNTFENS